MKRQRYRALILALSLIGAQAASLTGMIGAVALLDSPAVKEAASTASAAAREADRCPERSDPLRLILF